MVVLAALLALDAVLHALLVYQYGIADKANMPFAIFIAVNAVLAALVLFGVPYSVVVALLLSLFGLVGLTVTFNKPKREDKTLDKVIWVNDLLNVLVAAYLLVAG